MPSSFSGSQSGCSAAHLRVRSSIGMGSCARTSAYMSPGVPPFGSGKPRPRSRIFVAFCVSGGTLNFTCPPFSVGAARSEEHTSELQSRVDLVCRLLLEKKNEQCKARPPQKEKNQVGNHVKTGRTD